MTNESTPLLSRSLLFTFSFFEGAAVMVCELLAAKMIAPFFGSSLYVWAAVLGVTLTALMSGYYLGGFVSNKYKSPKTVLYILGVAGLLLIIMPHLGALVMSGLIDMSVQAGSTISLLIFMFPPLLLMGMTSPVIIDLINEKVETSGKSAGSIYAISTLGGIFATFLTGFYLLPELGIRVPSLIFGIILVLLASWGMLKQMKLAAMLFLMGGIGLGFAQIPGEKEVPGYKVLYESEGILGQVKVVERPFGQGMARWLMVNNTGQSFVYPENPAYTPWQSSRFFSTAVSVYPENSDLLLLGLGGGMFYNQFSRLGFNMDIVELDPRIAEVSKEFFGVPNNQKVIVDDARHYINTCNETYDVIMMDLFLNETPPGHVLSKEAFQQADRLLKDEGMILINFYGYLEGDKGRAARSIIKTLENIGFEVNFITTPGEPKDRNLIILASRNFKDFSNTRHAEPHLQAIGSLEPFLQTTESLDLGDAEVLTDAVPAMESMYVDAAIEWRQVVTDHFTQQFIERDIQIFR